MLGAQVHGGPEVVLPALQGLVRQTVNEVQRHVGDLGLPGGGHGVADLLEGVDAAQAAQLLVVGGLHPQGDAVEAPAAQGAERLPVPGGVRVGLEGDLGVFVQVVVLFHGLEQAAQPLGAQVGGGAAAEIHRVHPVALRPGGSLGQVGAQGLHIFVHPCLGPGQGVKVAVDALAFAKGHVDIQAQGQLLGFHGHRPPVGNGDSWE